VKSKASLWRSLAVVSVSIGVLLVASKLGNAHHRTDSRRTSVLPKKINFALKEGQTIVAVSDTTQAICFYIGNDEPGA